MFNSTKHVRTETREREREVEVLRVYRFCYWNEFVLMV